MGTTSGREPTDREGDAARQDLFNNPIQKLIQICSKIRSKIQWEEARSGIEDTFGNTHCRKVDYVKPIVMAVTLYPTVWGRAHREVRCCLGKEQPEEKRPKSAITLGDMLWGFYCDLFVEIFPKETKITQSAQLSASLVIEILIEIFTLQREGEGFLLQTNH